MNMPNKLTLLRVILVPAFIACFYLPGTWRLHVAAAVFVLAYITDILDGYIARKHNIVTDFGKLMDPMADKLITGAAVIMLTAEGLLHPVLTFIIIGRELVISAFRLVTAKEGVVIAANNLGKLKTLTQCTAIVLLMFHSELRPALSGFPLDTVIVWISIVFTVWSAIDYIMKNKQLLKLS